MVEPWVLDGRGDRQLSRRLHHRNVIVEVDLEHMVEFGDAERPSASGSAPPASDAPSPMAVAIAQANSLDTCSAVSGRISPIGRRA